MGDNMVRLYERLDGIKTKQREIRKEKLDEICTDSDIINDALEIAKHESSIYLPGVSLITAVGALLLSFSNNPLTLSFFTNSPGFSPWAIPFVLVIVLIYVIRLIYFEFRPWMEVYYDLIELRKMRREETEPTVLSKCDDIIREVKAINPRIDDLEKNIRIKLEDLEKDIKSIKSRKWL